MIGRTEADLKQIIEAECQALPEAVEPKEVLEGVATVVARAITKNNEAIGMNLRVLIRRGIIQNAQTIADLLRSNSS